MGKQTMTMKLIWFGISLKGLILKTTTYLRLINVHSHGTGRKSNKLFMSKQSFYFLLIYLEIYLKYSILDPSLIPLSSLFLQKFDSKSGLHEKAHHYNVFPQRHFLWRYLFLLQSLSKYLIWLFVFSNIRIFKRQNQ